MAGQVRLLQVKLHSVWWSFSPPPRLSPGHCTGSSSSCCRLDQDRQQDAWQPQHKSLEVKYVPTQ